MAFVSLARTKHVRPGEMQSCFMLSSQMSPEQCNACGTSVAGLTFWLAWSMIPGMIDRSTEIVAANKS